MASHPLNLPEYVIGKKRKRYTVFYFQVPLRIRPKGWPGAIRLGRDDLEGLEEVSTKARSLKKKMDAEKRGNELGIVLGPKEGSFPDIIKKYKSSEFWTSLRPATQKSYDQRISKIEAWSKEAGHPHIRTIKAKHLYAFLSNYSNRPRERQYLKAALSILLNTAVIHGYIETNVAKEVDLPQRRDNKYKVILWTDDDVKNFIETAKKMGWASIGRAVLISYDTSQRQTDVLSMQSPRDYKDGMFILEQSKTGREIIIPATKWLRSELKGITGLLCKCEVNDGVWTTHYFSHKFREIAIKAGLNKHLFKQLRHSHLINLERAGCSEHERNAHSGHTKQSGNALMDRSYGLDRDEKLAVSAVQKLERMRTKKQKVV